MFGAPKSPSFTQLIRTALKGDTELLVRHKVEGWLVGDEIVITPSSFGHEEHDTAVITSITTTEIKDFTGRTVEGMHWIDRLTDYLIHLFTQRCTTKSIACFPTWAVRCGHRF